MVINNHKRIDILEAELSSEQARVRYLEDFSEQLDDKVGGLERSMEKIKKEISGQKKSLVALLTIVKLISGHERERRREGKFMDIVKSAASVIIQNAFIFGLIQVMLRVSFLDQIIDSLLGLLRFGNILSRRTAERSRFMAKISLSLTIFFLLKERIRNLMEKIRSAFTYLNI